MSSFEQVAEFSQIPAEATINFYERVYKNVKDFCEGSTDSDVPIRTGIRQLIDNAQNGNIQMPPSFIDNKKLDMLMLLRKKIQEEQVKKDIDLIWAQWSRILYEKEQQEANLLLRKKIQEEQVKKDIDLIWAQWSGILYKKKQQEANHPNTDPQPSHDGEEVSSPPSVKSVASPGTSLSSPTTHPGDVSLPQTPRTPDDDKLIGDPIIIPVFDSDPDGNTFKWGEFKYMKKQSGKVICLNEDCNIPFSQTGRIRHKGVTIQTLKNHALKDHLMKVNFKDLKGIRANPIKCDLCTKHFSRPQTLKDHVQKIHSAENTPNANNNQNHDHNYDL